MKAGDKVVAISKSIGCDIENSRLFGKPMFIVEIENRDPSRKGYYCNDIPYIDQSGESFLIKDLITFQEYIKQMRNKKLKRILNGKNTNSI